MDLIALLDADEAAQQAARLCGIITEAELAALLGITRQRVSELARSGILKRVAPARFDMCEAVKAYCANLREQAGRAGRPSLGGDELKAQKIRQARESADKLEIQNQAARRELVPAIEVQREWESILRGVRAGLLAVPSRVATRLGHLTAHDLSEMDLEIRAVLAELAE